ncbi:MAG: hypothetical protein ABW167_00115 [Baekduia sp.]
MPDHRAQEHLARTICGRLSEWEQLNLTLGQRLGLTVIAAAPLSGTTGLLQAALGPGYGDGMLVDARRCADALDLAMAIADQAVASYCPEEVRWWQSAGPPQDQASLRLARSLSAQSIDLDGVRLGEGRRLERLDEAFALIVALANEVRADRPPTLVIDHLGTMLATVREHASRELLDQLRTIRQRHTTLDLVLVDYPAGPIVHALGDPDHPLYRAGQTLNIARAHPAQFLEEAGGAGIKLPRGLLGAAAELAAGAPALVWPIVDLSDADGGDDTPAAARGWQRLRDLNAASVSAQWDLLRRVHPSAQTLVSAMAFGLAPYSTPVADKSITDGLNRLRDVGIVWQPEDGSKWAIADQLLAAYARDHAPAWIARRTAQARARS